MFVIGTAKLGSLWNGETSAYANLDEIAKMWDAMNRFVANIGIY